MSDSRYPEHDKLAQVKVEKDHIIGFLDFLRYTHTPQLTTLLTDEVLRAALAAYFKIDPDKLAAEKLALYEELRVRCSTPSPGEPPAPDDSNLNELLKEREI